MAINKAKKITRNAVLKSIPEYYCRRCQTYYMSPSNFYTATNPQLDKNGFLSVCKKCCSELYEENFNIYKEYSRAIMETCRDLDICFSYGAFDMAFNQLLTLQKTGRGSEADMFGYYKSKLSSSAKNFSNEYRGARFKDSDAFKFESEIIKDIEKKLETPEEELERLRKKWGTNKDKTEYEFLEDELFKIQHSFECSDYGMQLLQMDICHINLAIEKERQKGGDGLKLIEARAKVMNDAKMKPIQASGIEANDAITFGTLIKKFENEKPIPVYMDNEMKKYIDTYFIGQLAKMEGIQNEYTDKFDKEMEEFTVDFGLGENTEDDESEV
jgi:hypothetical protein